MVKYIKALGKIGLCGFIAIQVNLVCAASTAGEKGAGDYSENPKALAFIDLMVTKHEFDRAYVAGILDQAEKKQSILDAMSRPAEKTKAWHEYRNIFLGKKRIQQGVEFWYENAKILSDVSKQYGVPEQIIVAIIGVETRYGRNTGSYRVVDALATLGFDYPSRGKFFTGQLEQFFILAREQNQDPLSLKGSYAGAMGYGQFIPSSYRTFARDYDGDGFADIWNNKADAIVSVANYFKAHGWIIDGPVLDGASVAKGVDEALFNSRSRPDRTVNDYLALGILPNASVDRKLKAVPLKYQGVDGPEYLFGFNNFYVITRYNRSRLYARAVWDLSQAIAELKAQPAIGAK